ncbi:PaaI family thioesterase [Novosphingobium sp. KCTC 2891]|uniref:PaaI family thioesterase n=1 Tax=Novosphingobium sp. KCTC 2891 TaxID=2989730 RepID=UPI00222364BA|nr:PaaI family thioesterase [Novosphingobium sp. KCTC 2891]MCW1382932.1 PaaI family thioesterase [Novosphingobium sp. KCTC 2891]
MQSDQKPSELPEAGWKPIQFKTPFLDESGPYFVPAGPIDPLDKGSGGLAIRVVPDHVNYVGIAHGGVLATFADVALSYELYRLEPGGLPVVTLSMGVNYLAAARLGDWLTSEVRIDRRGRKVAHVSGRILCGSTPIMTMTGVYNLLSAAADGNAPKQG